MIFNMSSKEWKEKDSYWTSKEIGQQPITWNKTFELIKENSEEIQHFINKVIKNKDYDIILTGAGTSEFVGNSVYSYLNTITDHKCKSYATTDIVGCPENYLSREKPTLLISYGRSGNSPESVAAVDVANVVCKDVHHLFITCNKEGALSKYAEGKDNCYAINLTPETHDQSFAMTSSFSNMYLATVLAFNTHQLDAMKQTLDVITTGANKIIDNGFEYIKNIVNTFNFERIVYLGSNTNKGIAQESSLKMLELTAGETVVMYDTPLGFRHGPKSILNPNTLTVVYLSDDVYTRKYEIDIIKEMSPQRNGNKIFVVSTHADNEVEKLVDYFYCVENTKSLNNVFLGLEYIIIAQLMAMYKSLSLDKTPDNPCPSGEVNRVVKGVIIYPYNI